MKNNLRSRVFFLILFAFAGYVTYLLVEPYLGTVVFAMVTVVVFRPVYDRLLNFFRGRQGLTTVVTILIIFILVLIPVSLIINLTVQQVFEFSHDLSQLTAGASHYPTISEVVHQINEVLNNLPFAQGYQLTNEQVLQAIETVTQAFGRWLADTAISLSTATADWVISFIIYVALLVALLPSYPKMIQLLRNMSPLSEEMDERYINRMISMTKSMVKGVLVIAVAQGLVLGLFMWIGGVKYTSFWTLLAIFMAMLPLGCGVVAVPIGIVHMILGNIWQGIVILLGYALVVTNIDYLLRPRLVSRDTQLHAALVLLSMFGGLKLFGFLGVIYGPVTMIFVITTIEIYLQYYRVAKVPEVHEVEAAASEAAPTS